MDVSQKKIALVTDWITHWGGAERVFERLMQLFPEADIYTSVYFPERPEVFAGKNIKTSFIQKIPFLNRRHKLCMLLRPLAFSRFDFSEYDLVISCTSAEAKGIIVGKREKIKDKKEGWKNNTSTTLNSSLLTLHSRAVHVCYCHTPTRYLWSHVEEYKNFLEFGWFNWLARMIIPPAFALMQRWDRKAAQRPDIFIANSINTQERIKKYYDRDSTVVYPFFQKNKAESRKQKAGIYFICLWRIVPYKRFDLAILACNQLNLPLKIFTSTLNDEVTRLQAISGPTIEWIFRASDTEVAAWLAGAAGFLMPQEEDFWIVALEAMSHGIPVIAYGKWGALETVSHGESGILFPEQTVDSLVLAMQIALAREWNPEVIQEHANKWNVERFDRGIMDVVQKT